MKKLPELIFNKSREGKIGYSFSETEFADDMMALDREHLREDIADFPQLSEVEIVRHYTNLSHLNHSVDSGFYPLGSCTMKYNPRINEKIAGFDVLVSTETVNYGDRMKEDEFRGQFVGAPAGQLTLSVTGDRETKDAEIISISGATISSEAVVEAMNDGATQIKAALQDKGLIGNGK